MSDSSDFISKAATFAENVRRELRDLPAEVVADLTDGLESDIAASLEDGASLPDVSQYALDLMRGAGIEIPNDDVGIQKKKRKIAEVVLRVADKVTTATSGLAPAWWVLRAWIVAQFIGVIVSNTDSNRPILAQWGELPILGIFIFVVLLYLSVRWGRSTKNSRLWVRYFATSVLGMSAVVLLWQPTFSSPPAESKWFMYAPETCRIIDVPSVVGITLGEAKMALERLQLPYVIFDQDAMTEIAYAPDVFEVLQQDPDPSEHAFCGERSVQLVVDLSQGPAELPSSDVLSTTTIPDDALLVTTTVPTVATTTTVKPKATSTTTP
ncbi:MAG: hypothetical protein F2618_00370 [Actinobacteria bacterium]|nr:hypothetical protein [Actinomycetota bacterium]